MRRSWFVHAPLAAALLLAASLTAAAGSFDAVAPLNGTTAGEVPPGGRAHGVGVLVAAGTTKGSLLVKASRGSGLVPRVALVFPDGTVKDQDALLAEGAKVKATAKSVSVTALPAFAASGLYRLRITGAPGIDGKPTSGPFTAKMGGKPAKGLKVPLSTISPSNEKEEFLVSVPENGVLSVKVKPAKGAAFGPTLQVVTASGDVLDHGLYAKIGKDDSITVKKMPVPFFGDFRIRIGSSAGTGDYSLAVGVKAGKPPVLPGVPVADAGGHLVAEQGALTLLDGSGSTAGASYLWVQVSGTPLSVTNNKVASPSVLAPQVRGTWAWQLVASNLEGPSLPSLAILQVDRAPVAYGGPSLSVSPGASADLDGTGSLDLDAGDVLTYEWTQVGGPPAVLDDPHSPTPSFPAAAGTYAFELRVHDGIASSPPDRVVVSSGGAGPASDAGRPVFVRLQDSVFLSGLRSRSSSGGTPSTFAWTPDAGNPSAVVLAGADGPAASFTAPRKAGILRFRLIADGDAAGADEAQVIVTTAIPVNGSPSARAGAAQSVATGAPFTLSGAASTDDGGPLSSFEWIQSGGPDAGLDPSGATAAGTAPATPSVTRFLLMVHDGRKYGAPDSVAVTAGTAPAPRANGGPDLSGNLGAVLTLDASGSVPADGQAITAWQWTQLSGKDWYDVDARDPGFDPASPSPRVEVPVSVSSLTPGRALSFALVVTDGSGASLQDLVTINFQGLTPNAQPQVSASTTASTFRPAATIPLAASASDGDGDTLSYSWTQVSGPSLAVTGGTTANASVTAPVATASFVFRVTVNDGTGSGNATSTADVGFSVNQPPAILVSSTPTSGPQGTVVALSGAGTTDPDDAGLSYAWTEVNPPGGSPVVLTGADTPSASFTQPAYAGSINSRRRTFRLTVTDSMGAAAAPSALVTFTPNQVPVLNSIVPAGDREIFYSNSGASSDRSETLTAGPTTDADGDPVTFVWRIVAGPLTQSTLLSSTGGSSVTFGAPKPTSTTPNSGGIYEIGVEGSDGVALSGETTIQVLVTASWGSDIYPLISGGCTSGACHASSVSPHFLQLSGGASTARTNLLNGRIAANDYQNSLFYTKLSSGSMPQGGPAWNAGLLALVRDWIEPEHNVSTKPGISTGSENN